MQSEQIQTKQVRLDDLKPIEAQGIDFSSFEGNRIPIEKVSVIDINSFYDGDGKKIKEPIQVKALKVESTVVTMIKNQEGVEVGIRASELFNLINDKKTGGIGWSKGAKAKLNNFLKKLNVEHPKQLIGKSAVIRLRKKENPDGSESEFLGFIL